MKTEVRTAKNISVRLSAALVCALVTLTAAVSCTGGSGETQLTTDALPTASPQTTAAPEPVTDPPVTETEFVTDPEEPTDFVIVCSPGALSLEKLFADGTGPDPSSAAYAALTRRDETLGSEYGVSLSRRGVTDVYADVRTGVLSGDGDFDVILSTASEGIRMMHSGLLQDLSETGIGLGAGADGARSGLARDLSVSGQVSLYFCDALLSDICSSYCLGFASPEDGTGLWDKTVSSLGQSALSGNFTVTALAEALKTLESLGGNGDVFGAGGLKGKLALLNAAGGRIFGLNSRGLPEVCLRQAAFSTAYTAASPLCAAEGTAPLIYPSSLGSLGEDAVFLPLPKVSADSRYVSFVDLDGCAVFSCPEGLVNGSRVSRLLTLLCLCSDGVRSGEKSRLASDRTGEFDENAAMDIILGSQTAECGLWYGWGDIDEYVASAMSAGTPVADLLADKDLAAREKAAAAAIAIIDGRLGE